MITPMAEPVEPPTLETLRRLAAFLPLFEEGFDFGYWEPSRLTDSGAYTVPYFVFSDTALEFLKSGAVQVFDWPTWAQTDQGQRLLKDQSAVESANADQLFKLLTALIRGDRFIEGNLAAAFESGLLTAIVRRADTLVRGVTP